MAQGLADAEEPFGVAEIVLASFLRIVTNAKIFDPPTPMETAVAFCQRLVECPVPPWGGGEGDASLRRGGGEEDASLPGGGGEEGASLSRRGREGNARGVKIALERVSVRIAGHLVLHDIDLAVAPRSHVAIVGPSGAGKSTLIGLLLGWYRPAAGRLLVDDSPLVGARLDALRRETAWVDPAVQLWNRSLVDNLRYGAGEAPSLAIGEVIEATDLRDVLERLPDGLQTRLGEGGGLVSGGEGQRVRLGRGLLRRDARLVILDEPFRGLERERRRALIGRARCGTTRRFCASRTTSSRRSRSIASSCSARAASWRTEIQGCSARATISDIAPCWTRTLRSEAASGVTAPGGACGSSAAGSSSSLWGHRRDERSQRRAVAVVAAGRSPRGTGGTPRPLPAGGRNPRALREGRR